MVIEFKKGHNNSRHINEMKLDENEAREFINMFLKPEIDRHLSAIKMCKLRIMLYQNLNSVVKVAYESSVLGHLDDIAAIEKTINDIKNKFGWINGEGI